MHPHLDGGWSGTVPEKYSEILAAGKSPHSYFKEGEIFGSREIRPCAPFLSR